MSFLSKRPTSVGSIPASPARSAWTDALRPDDRDLFTLFGWAALFDGLRLVDARQPGRELSQSDTNALAEFIGHRRDALLHHHFPRFSA